MRALAMEMPSARIVASRVAVAEKYSAECGGQSLIVMQGGAVLDESYASEQVRSRPISSMSLTKNIAALAIFAARAEHLLDLEEPASKTITEWSHDDRGSITIRELLNQTSGLSDGYNAIYASGVANKNIAAVAQRLVYPPGSQFDYAPSNYEILEVILRRKLEPSGRTPLGYLRARVLTPLGITPADWRHDKAGNPFFSAGAKLTPHDIAKIGEFIRTRGRVWVLPALPQSAFQGCFTGSSANSMYGLSFWLNANASRSGVSEISIEGTLGDERSPSAWQSSCISSVAPPDLVAMVGSGGLRVYIVPSMKLVVVRTGTGGGFSDAEFLGRLFGSSAKGSPTPLAKPR